VTVSRRVLSTHGRGAESQDARNEGQKTFNE
jgi:hypothetical protein